METMGRCLESYTAQNEIAFDFALLHRMLRLSGRLRNHARHVVVRLVDHDGTILVRVGRAGPLPRPRRALRAPTWTGTAGGELPELELVDGVGVVDVRGGRAREAEREAGIVGAALAAEHGAALKAMPEARWLPLVDIHLVKKLDIEQSALKFWPFRTGQDMVPQGFIHYLRPAPYFFSQMVRGRQ